MTTANKITLVRIAMIPFFVVFAILGGPVYDTVALVLFCVASVTDFLDGYIARKYNQVTDFGKFVDPLADKLLVTAALVIFVERGLFAAWMVFIILAREFIITSLRNVAAAKGPRKPASSAGKGEIGRRTLEWGFEGGATAVSPAGSVGANSCATGTPRPSRIFVYFLFGRK